MADIYITYLRMQHLHFKASLPGAEEEYSPAGMWRLALWANMLDWGFWHSSCLRLSTKPLQEQACRGFFAVCV